MVRNPYNVLAGFFILFATIAFVYVCTIVAMGGCTIQVDPPQVHVDNPTIVVNVELDASLDLCDICKRGCASLQNPDLCLLGCNTEVCTKDGGTQ